MGKAVTANTEGPKMTGAMNLKHLAYEAYKKAMASSYEAYKKTMTPAYEAYEKATAPEK